MTIDQLIEKLQKLREEHGGERKVYIDVPWEDGLMSHCEDIKNIFFAESAYWLIPTSRES